MWKVEGQLSKCVWQKDLLLSGGRIRQQLYGEISGGHKVPTNFGVLERVIWCRLSLIQVLSQTTTATGRTVCSSGRLLFSASGCRVAVTGNLESSLKVQCFYLEALPFILSYPRCTNWGLVLEIWDRLNLRLLMAGCCTRLKKRTIFCQVSTSRPTRPTWLEIDPSAKLISWSRVVCARSCFDGATKFTCWQYWL